MLSIVCAPDAVDQVRTLIVRGGVNFRRASAVALMLAAVVFLIAPALAHPLGNFTINHYSAIETQADGFAVTYVLDLAEIPTFQELGRLDEDGMARHLTTRLWEWSRGLRLMAEGGPVPLALRAAQASCLPGAGGLPILRVEEEFWAGLGERGASVDAGNRPVRVVYQDTNFPARVGWKEIVVTGRGVLMSSVPATDRGSNRLRSYPVDLLKSPPDDTVARFSANPAGPRRPGTGFTSPPIHLELSGCRQTSAAPRVGPTGQPGAARYGAESTAFGALFVRVTGGVLSPRLLAAILVGASVLGAYHAMTPGHGKAMLAAYFVGSRGTPAQAVLLGTVTTLTHTSGVFMLGLATLAASRYVLPEKLYPWLSILSGAMLAGVGASLFRRRLAAIKGTHDHAYVHHHHDNHEHAAAHHHHLLLEEPVRARDLITLGITGGLLPCPSALVVMLAAISVGQTALGLVLITAFSLGLAAVLVAGGLLMVHGRAFMARLLAPAWGGLVRPGWRRLLGAVLPRLPVFSAAAVALLGFAIIIQTVAATWASR